MKRDVLFLCQFFYPEYNSSATLPFDTARYLAQSGYSVDALCGYPREYNTSGEVSAREMKDGVSIHRLHYIQFCRRSKLGRLINYFSFTLSVLLHIFEIKNYKTVIVYSNPPVLPIAAIWANRLFNTKIIFVSYDVYPEVAYASGSLTSGGVITRVMQGINRSLFKRADTVVALTDEMREFLLRNRPELSEDRVVTIANWAHEAPSEGAADARRKLGYAEDDFVVSYFGNLGVCQDETALIQAMELLKDRPHIKFMVAGHGSKLPLIRQAAEHLPNVRICGRCSQLLRHRQPGARPDGHVRSQQVLQLSAGRSACSDRGGKRVLSGRGIRAPGGRIVFGDRRRRAACTEYPVAVPEPGNVRKNVEKRADAVYREVCKKRRSGQVCRLV